MPSDRSAGAPLSTGVDTARTSTIRVDRRLMRESTAARPHFILAGGLGVITALLTVAQAALLAHAITAVAIGHADLAAVSTTLALLAAVLGARAIVSGLFELSGRIGAARVLAELRERLAVQLLIVRPGHEPGERTGELAASAVQGVDALEDYFAGYLPAMMLALTVPLAVMIWVVPLDPIVAVIFAVTVPLLIVFMILIGLGAQSRASRRWRELALLSSHFLDVVRGLETLRAHRRELAQAESLAEVGERYRQETMGTLKLAFLSALVLELCATVGTGLAAATIGVQLTGGHLGLQAGLTVLLLAPELYAPLRSVGQQFHAAADGLAAAGHLLEVLDQPGLLTGSSARFPALSRETCGATQPPPLPDPRNQPLTFDMVSFTYPNRPGSVLTDLQLTIAPGEFVAVCGPSGVGKSTLAALAMRIADPTAGTVRCGATDLRSIDPQQWRSRVAWVPQRTRIFAGTLAENIALSTPDAPESRLRAAAAAAGLTDLLDSLPDGLNTRVGDAGRRLSAGQSQRVALARAFLSDASLVVLDEPTANLDDDTAHQVAGAIVALADDRTVLMITHDPRLAAVADRTVTLSPPARPPAPAHATSHPLAPAPTSATASSDSLVAA